MELAVGGVCIPLSIVSEISNAILWPLTKKYNHCALWRYVSFKVCDLRREAKALDSLGPIPGLA